MATPLALVVTQNLECPVCFDLFNEPKQLSCTHIYCKECLLRLYESQPENDNNLSCPVCRQVTVLKGGDVATLQTNLPIKSLVEDVKNAQQKAKQICTNCDSDEKSLAETYCQECEEYMCVLCYQIHANWKKNYGHDVIIVNDIIAGKSSIQKRHRCNEHPSEEEEFVCIDCKKCICFRCRMLVHEKLRHHVVEVQEYEKNHKKNIESLLQQADMRKTAINKHIRFVEEQQDTLTTLLGQQREEINQSYEDYLQQLNKRRDMLINEYKQHIQVQHSKLECLKGADCKQVTSISSASELVGNGMKIPLHDQVLTVHNTLCEELQGLLERDEPEYVLPRNITEHAKQVTFHRHKGQNGLHLGNIEIAHQDIALPREDSMDSMVSMPDGKIAVGSCFGGIELFSVDGPHGSVMKNVNVRRVSFLSDGRYVVRDTSNNISLYTPQCERLDVKFDTLSHEEGGLGGLDADKDDHIYTSYRELKKIHVFKPTGGKAVREITCDGYEPQQIFVMKSNKMIVVKSENTVSVIDESGVQKYDAIKDGVYAYPAVCHDNTILIAWVKHEDGLLTIDKYSHEMEYIKTLIKDYTIHIPERDWYYVQEIVTGEIAFCSSDRLYIFHKSLTL